MKKILRIILLILLALLAIFLAIVIYVVSVAAQAPVLDVSSVEPDGYLTTVLDDDETVILTLAGSEANRIYVKLDRIPDQLEEAVIAIEDSRFYSHNGIDLKSIARAIWIGISTGNLSQGGSTITQQLLKNNVFTGWTSEETLMDRVTRKIQEQYLAICLEKEKSKEWILENYLNTINLGAGTWGVEAAANKYFNKDVSELNLAECAVLAGITKSPTNYDPIEYPENCRERQHLVLEAMLEQGYITQEQYEEALAFDVFTEIAENHNVGNNRIFSYFEDTLIQQVSKDLMENCGYTEEEAWEAIYRGGLTIYSTQDSAIQDICEEVANSSDYYSGDAQVSVVVASVEDGSVKGIVGGRGEKDASLVYNRATDSLRQPGSTIKIIGEYAAAMEDGIITLASVYQDVPQTYSDGTTVHNASGIYSGRYRIRKAITFSTNTLALQVFNDVGMDRVVESLEAFGVSTLTEADEVEPLALGGTSGGVTNLEMTAAYNTLANDGEYREPYFYYRVLDHDGNILLENKPESRRVVSIETAELLTKAMEDVLTLGTGSAVYYSDGYSLAAKTGTTTDNKDLWMMGYSPFYTCGVWGGFDNNEEQTETSYVKMIWKGIMQQINAGKTGYFTDEGNYVTATICTKCGNLAVSGLCDVTVQGNMTYTEYFASGTQPRSYCDCHEKVEVCSDCGLLTNSYCPDSSRITKVYLKDAEAGSGDADYCLDRAPKGTCTEHYFLWDYIEEEEEEEDNSGSGGGWRDWWNSLWGGDSEGDSGNDMP